MEFSFYSTVQRQLNHKYSDKATEYKKNENDELFNSNAWDKNAFIVTVRRSDHKISSQVIHSKKCHYKHINKQTNKQ